MNNDNNNDNSNNDNSNNDNEINSNNIFPEVYSGEIQNQNENQNSSNYSYRGDQLNTDYNYYAGSNNSDKKIKESKPKKHGFFNLVKLTAAAIVFGIIAGGVFQGYSYLTRPDSAQTSESESTTNGELPVVTTQDNTSDTVIVPTSTTTDGIITDVSDVVEKVMPSIVAINSSGTATSYDFFGRQSNQPFEGSGSGIIIGQKGSELLIVTNNHVIEGAETVEIVFTDDTKAQATIKGAEANTDLAVLSVPMEELSEETAATIKVATLGNSDEVKAGEMAIAIGNALGYGQSVTVGYISAVDRKVNIENMDMTLLQTDAAINPGNSGGALINTLGEVIGINSVKYASAEVEGMGYAIPISSAVPMINELMNREIIDESEQGFLGIYADSAQNVTEIYAERFNMPIGVYINQVVEDSPADNAGVKQGQIITKVNDQSIKTIEDLLNILSYKKAGETITVTVNVLDNGEYVEKNLAVTLGEKQ